MTVRHHPPPPFDPELSEALSGLARELPPTMTSEMLPTLRSRPRPKIEDVLFGRPIKHRERTIPGVQGTPDLTISVFCRTDHAPGGPGIYYVHGGGMIMGDRFSGVTMVLDWVEILDAVAVAIEYRLAPEHPDPAPIDDCYAGLIWTFAHAEELLIDPDRLIIAGTSAGGGLAAGVTLKSRDFGGPQLVGQVLAYPMLDDRNQTVSSHQIDGIGVWDRASNDMAWGALLGERRGTEQVSIYAAPARAEDLSGLPPAFLDVGSAEVFRDETVAYASRIWACGGIAELHVWPGGFHGFDVLAPQATLSALMRKIRTRWVRRLFHE
jgi:acetyl esterase/lipase